MKIMLRIWLLGVLGTIAYAQSSPQYLTQGAHYDSEEALHHPSDTRYFRLRSHEHESYEGVQANDPRHYQSLEQYHQPSTGHYSSYQPQHQNLLQRPAYQHPEDPSYHRAQEISHHEPRQQYQRVAAQYEDQSHTPYHEPRQQYQHSAAQYEDQSRRPYHEPPQHYQQAPPQYEEHDEGSHHEPRQQHQQIAPQYEEQNHASHSEPEVRESPNYSDEDSDNVREPSRSRSPHPAPVPTDPKLPLYFTMYEKRVIRDPLSKYGKGPWRYLTHGYGITYGSKEPGKVFEKGYGYIRALGRDTCKLPEHLCPPTDDKPFEYEGRKEPYFGYRPH